MVEVHKVNGGLRDHEGNVYLVLDEIVVLIDAGMDPEVVIENIKKHVDPRKIESILLTHCHHDHTAGVPQLKEATGAQVFIHEKEVGDIGDDITTGSYIYNEDPAEFEVNETLHERKIIDLGEWKLEVLHTPGHSPGSVAFYEPRAKVLFSGDTILPHGNIGRTRRADEEVWDLVDSIEKLAALEVEVLYPGHMEPTDENVKGQIQTSLQFAKSIH
jgi:hydroxyacylglutathione hydrolase